jgi:hypothetical protein
MNSEGLEVICLKARMECSKCEPKYRDACPIYKTAFYLREAFQTLTGKRPIEYYWDGSGI